MKLSRTASACKHTCRPEATGIVRGTPRKSGANLDRHASQLTNVNKTKKVTLVNSPDPDLAAWCAALASPVPSDAVPPGWLTTRQIAAKLGKSDSTVGTLLCRAVREGRAQRQHFRIPAAGTVRPVPHYKVAK